MTTIKPTLNDIIRAVDHSAHDLMARPCPRKASGTQEAGCTSLYDPTWGQLDVEAYEQMCSECAAWYLLGQVLYELREAASAALDGGAA